MKYRLGCKNHFSKFIKRNRNSNLELFLTVKITKVYVNDNYISKKLFFLHLCSYGRIYRQAGVDSPGFWNEIWFCVKQQKMKKMCNIYSYLNSISNNFTHQFLMFHINLLCRLILSEYKTRHMDEHKMAAVSLHHYIFFCNLTWLWYNIPSSWLDMHKFGEI